MRRVLEERGQPRGLHLVSFAQQRRRQPVPERFERVARSLGLVVANSQAKSPPTAGVLLNLGLVERHVVAHVEGIAADRHRLPELDGQLVLEQPDRHPLDRDRVAVVACDAQLGLDLGRIELLLGIIVQRRVQLGQIIAAAQRYTKTTGSP